MVRAGLGLLLAVAAISWAAILIRLCEAPSFGIAFYRLLIASVLLVPFGFRGGRTADRRTVFAALGAGFLLALHFATWISSLEYTSVASSVTLVATQPVFAAVLGPVFLGERPGRAGIGGVALAGAGIVVLGGADLALGAEALAGDLLALAGALTGAGYLMIGRGVRERISFAGYLLAVNGACTAFLLVFAVVARTRLSGFPASTWLLFVALAIGPHLLGHGMLNWSVRRLRSFAVNLAVLGEPVLSTVYAALIFGEFPSRGFYVGAVLIGVGVTLALREEARRFATADAEAAPRI